MNYVLKTLLQDGLGLNYQLTHNENEFEQFDGAKIRYSRKRFLNAITIEPHAILTEFGIKDYYIQVKSDPVFEKTFFQTQNGDIPFDIFGASFWLLSRYEEYLPHKADSEGRFSYRSGLAYQYDFLHYPLVNVWLEALKNLLLQKFPQLKFKNHVYTFVSTIDVDNVYRYKYKGFVRTMAGFISDKNWKERFARWRIILGKEPDPFDCYDFLIQTHQSTGTEAIFFFLLGDYGPNDKNHASTDLRFQSLIKHLADYSKVGLHPSFGSNARPRQLRKELARLGNITHRYISKSRQHFSMLRFPQTYRDLLSSGMSADYSMGYTNYNGFRASYCYPYRWYSLELESISTLNIHPYCISEVTLFRDAEKKGTPPLELATSIIAEVQKYNGELISIFHNHMFSPQIREFYVSFLAATQTQKH